MLKPDNQQLSGKSNQRCPEEHQQPNTDNDEEDEQSNTDNGEGDEQPKTDNNEVHVQPSTDNDKEDDIVPVVIRPGHIRFENLGKGVYVSESSDVQFNYLWHLSLAIYFMSSYAILRKTCDSNYLMYVPVLADADHPIQQNRAPVVCFSSLNIHDLIQWGP